MKNLVGWKSKIRKLKLFWLKYHNDKNKFEHCLFNWLVSSTPFDASEIELIDLLDDLSQNDVNLIFNKQKIQIILNNLSLYKYEKESYQYNQSFIDKYNFETENIKFRLIKNKGDLYNTANLLQNCLKSYDDSLKMCKELIIKIVCKNTNKIIGALALEATFMGDRLTQAKGIQNTNLNKTVQKELQQYFLEKNIKKKGK